MSYLYASPDTRLEYSANARRVAIVQATAGCLSCVTAATMIGHISFLTVRPYIVRWRHGIVQDGGESTFLKRQVGLFILCLFISDLFQSLTGMMQIRWADKGGVDIFSAACRAQGVALFAGDLGTCYFNVVIAIHTFVTIVTRKAITPLGAILIIGGGWVWVIVMTLIGPLALEDERGSFWGIAGLWCFIPDEYGGPRVWLHYFPIYCSAFVIFVVYGSVFWKLRRHLQASQGTSQTQRTTNPVADEQQARTAQVSNVANKLLWYPTSYLCLILPISIGRIVNLRGNYAPQWYLNLGITLLYLSGFVNGIIYASTRRALAPIYWPTQRRPNLSFLKKRTAAPTTYAVWVTHEEEHHEPGEESKYAVALELSDSVRRTESTTKVASRGSE